MAKETEEAPSQTGANTAQTDLLIKQLQTQLKDQTEKHNFQQKRANRLESDLNKEKMLNASLTVATEKASPVHDCVVLDGIEYDVVATFRADSTFVEVKRGHCNEGVTLVAIGKPH